MPALRPGTLLLDWDNTLHDADGVFFRALRTVLGGHGIGVDVATYRARYDPDYRVLYARLGVPAEMVDELSVEWQRLVRDAEPRLIPGAGPALERIRATGIPTAVVTAAPRELVEWQMAATGLDWLPAAVCGGETAPRPDPAPLRRAIERIGVAAEPVVYVGDTAADMEMAVAAGVHGVGVAGFASSEALLLAAGAAETASSFAAWASRWC